jgi:hypothetical protein
MQNKNLILGALAVLGIFLAVQFLVVQDNWAAAAAKQTQAEAEREQWEKNFKGGGNLMPRPEAEAALAENKKQLQANLALLQKIEFGTKESLREYSESAAGTGDRKNYLATKRTTLLTKAKESMQITAPSELGLGDKTSEDPVALNLMRLALVESFFLAGHKAGVTKISKIQHFPPKFVKGAPEEVASDEDSDDDKKSDKKKSNKDEDAEEEKPAGDRLVQFHMRVSVQVSERVFGRLLYELQKPSEPNRGYLGLRGFQVAVRDTGSGMVDGTVAVSALISEKLAHEFNIPLKSDADPRRGGSKELNLDRGY